MKENVRQAIEELRSAFPSAEAEEDGGGGAFVTIPDFPFGDYGWEPAAGPLSTHVKYNYPDSDVYPFFAPEGLRRANGSGWPSGGFSSTCWNNRPVVQISMRMRGGWNPNCDTLSTAIASVCHFLVERR